MKKENSKDEINNQKETEDIKLEKNDENMNKENDENTNKENDEKEFESYKIESNEIEKEAKEIVNEEKSSSSNVLEPKRIKIPLVGLILLLMIIITGIIVGTIIFLKLN